MTSEKRNAACERISKGNKQKNQPDILRHSHPAAEIKIPNDTPHTNAQKRGVSPCIRPPKQNTNTRHIKREVDGVSPNQIRAERSEQESDREIEQPTKTAVSHGTEMESGTNSQSNPFTVFSDPKAHSE